MRILVWRAELLPGSETFVRAQVEALRSLGHDVRLTGVSRRVSAVSRSDDLLIFEGGTLAKLERLLFLRTGMQRRVTEVVRSFQPDVIQAHFGSDALLISRVARKLRVPLAITLHGYDVTALPNARGLKGVRYRARLRGVLARADLNVAVSQFIREQALRLGASGRNTMVLYTGIPIHGQEAKDVPRRKARDGGILHVGRMVEKKGGRDLLLAVTRLPLDLRGVQVTFVGDGPLLPAMRALAKSNGVNARFLGAQSPKQIAHLLSSAEILCVPSRRAVDGDSEGLGHVFLEAGLHSVPVVAYDHGGVGEAVVNGVTGLLAPEGDVECLSASLAQLLKEPAYGVSLGEAARKNVTFNFDVAVQTARFAAHLQQLVDPSVRRPNWTSSGYGKTRHHRRRAASTGNTRHDDDLGGDR